MSHQNEFSRGIASALTAYTLWGLAPVYWKLLRHIDPVEAIAHRIVWALPTLLIAIALTRSWSKFKPAFKSWRTIGWIALSTVLIISNWFMFVYAIVTDRILATSLGYFINPIVFAVLGFVVLREPLRRLQWFSVGLAFIGVFYLAFSRGALPWISLTLAGTFAFYGLIRKRIEVTGLHGLSVEVSFCWLFAIGYLAWIGGEGALASGDSIEILLVMCAGPVTAAPLFLFTYAVKRIRLATVGILQYLAPTMTFFLGVFVYNEPFDNDSLITFAFIWTAVALYLYDTWRIRQRVEETRQ